MIIQPIRSQPLRPAKKLLPTDSPEKASWFYSAAVNSSAAKLMFLLSLIAWQGILPSIGYSQDSSDSQGSVAAVSPASDEHSDPKSDLGWDQWRGPDRTAELKFSLPEKLEVKLAWKVDNLGPSYSGPITDGERLFTTATVDRKNEVAIAYDRKTGKQIWKTEWPGAMTVPFFAASNGSWIRSTPAYDDQSVYVVGIQDVLLCLDSETGDERWRIDFAKQYETGNPPFGAVCSPLVAGEFLFLQAANRLFKLNKSDGSVVWESMKDQPGMSTGGCFSSPILTKLKGRQQLLVQSRSHLAGVDPEKGTVLWKVAVPNFRGMNILTPSVWKDSVFTSSYNNQSFLFESNGKGAVEEKWKSAAKGYMASPIILNDHVYLLLQNGRFACLSLSDGNRTWTSEKKIGDYVSCITDAKKILLLSNDGKLTLINANPDYMETIGQYQLPEINNSWAHIGIGITEGQLQLFVRSIDSLRVYNW